MWKTRKWNLQEYINGYKLEVDLMSQKKTRIISLGGIGLAKKFVRVFP